MSQFLQWTRSHIGAILATAIATSNAHLVPLWVGKVAEAVAVACGASN